MPAAFRLKAKPVRTASGIAVVAVMSKPHRCPHIATTGNICVYCPGGPDSDFEYSTQSYTGYEPTSMRAIRARYHPYVQARTRVDQLRKLGHSVDKVTHTAYTPRATPTEQSASRRQHQVSIQRRSKLWPLECPFPCPKKQSILHKACLPSSAELTALHQR